MASEGDLTLSCVTLDVVDCEHKTAPTATTGIPSIRTTDIERGRLDLVNCNRVSEQTFEEWTRRRIPQPGDIILAREAPVGEVGIIPPDTRVCLGQRTVLIVPDREKVDSRYLLYLLMSETVRDDMEARSAGSTVPHLNMSDIRALSLPDLPDRPTQERIGCILGQLDDKIELNRRMNETLEATARAIFKSWFVDFDPVVAKAEGRQPALMSSNTAALFPDHFEDSPAGPIPAGWTAMPLSEAVEINPTRRLTKGANAPYLEMSNMPTEGPRPRGWYDRPFNSGMRFRNGDVLMARITPCLEHGKTAFVDFLNDDHIGWGSTEFIVMRAKPPLTTEFAYFLARSDDVRSYAIGHMTGSSGRQRVPRDCFDHYQTAIPSEPIAKRFGTVARNSLGVIKGNDEESRSLAAIRDTLLPKLLSGEIRIRDASKAVEEIV